MAPLIFERMEFLDREKNPYFEHAEAEYFLAERDGEPVGRITAQVDARWDEYQGGSDAMFGFFETATTPRWPRRCSAPRPSGRAGKGRSRILGPMDFTTNDEIGILIEGYELRPMILEPWHPPLLPRADRGRGLRQGDGRADVGTAVRRPQGGGELRPLRSTPPRRRRCATKGSSIRNMRKRDMAGEVRRFMDVYNEAWGSNWGFVPITDAEVEFQAKNLKQVLDEDWAFMAEKDGEVVGAAL